MLEVLAIIISLVLLIYLAFKGWSVVLIAPVLACVGMVLTELFLGTPGGIHIMATYTEVFMKALGNYVKTYFPFFMLGAIFGTVMDYSGSAKSIANWIFAHLGSGKEALAVVVACALLTYGGVSLFVVVFAIYPIGAILFRKAGVPKRFLPGCIAAGAFTFTMTAIPGTPQIQNTIPMRFFGTDAFAAPVLGIISAALEFILIMLWLNTRIKKAMAKGEGYGDHNNENLANVDDSNLPSFGTALLPIIIVIVLNLILSKGVYTEAHAAAFTYLEDPDTYATKLSSVAGTWSLIIALIAGIVVCLFMNMKRFSKGPVETLKDGVQGSFLAIMNTASEVGYGNVISSLAGYQILAGAMASLAGGNPLISGAVFTTVLAGVTGSASGGMSIALNTIGDSLMEQADKAGISYQALHRVVAIASGGMDSLPHNGAVITLLMASQMTHKESYVDIGMCTVVIPLIVCVIAIILATIGVC